MVFACAGLARLPGGRARPAYTKITLQKSRLAANALPAS
jgi:hypothetical protein